jgi:F-type H+-transporting ATPase subunit epsilon
MAEALELEIVTPERLLVREEVTEVQIPAKNGYLGILPGHAPLLAELGTGYMHYEAGGRKWYMAIHGGFLEVLGAKVRVLADAAERAEEIDVARAREDMKKAEEQVFNPSLGVDPASALNEMASAQARLDAAEQKSAA